jgi:hypothetical protein
MVLAAYRRVGAVLIAVVCVFLHAHALRAASVARRTRVVVRVEGGLSKAQRDALATLLDVDFRRRDLTLSMETSGEDVRKWIDRARADDQTLLVAILDVSRPGSWRLFIVDAARGRAITRPLVGGVEANAAALEAVASIVSSAANALQDGLEVASKPIDEVVARAESKPSPPTATEPVLPAPASEPPPPAPAKFVLRSVLAAAAASFTKAAPIAGGLSASIGVRYQSLSVRLFGARYLPARIETAVGDFSVHRTDGGISFGPTFTWGRVEMEPEAGFVGELLRRTDAAAGLDASPGGDRTLHRIGAMADVRLRYSLGGPFAVEWMVGASYLAPQVRFLAAGAQISELAVPWPWTVGSQIGVEVRAP